MGRSEDSLPLITTDSSIPARFTQVVRRRPDKPAIVDGAQRISYAELDAWSERIAQTIVEAVGDQPQPIALSFSHGIPVIAAMLGVLKVGHFYAVLDTAMPANRVRAVLDNLHSGYLLTNEGSDPGYPGMQVLLCPAQPEQPLSAGTYTVAAPDALAAIHYTSGTTGQPKGVMVDHAMLLTRAGQFNEPEPVTPCDVVANLFSPAYSSAAADIYGTLLNGATLACYRPAQHHVGELRDWLIASQVTRLHLHAGILRQLLDVLSADFRFEHLCHVRPSGRTRVNEVRRLRRHLPPTAIVIHQLASSETAAVTRMVIRGDSELEGEILPVGYPIHPEQVTLMGADGQPTTGEGIGEIEVRSRYLARGYWNQPELTEQRFQTDPTDPHYRIYRMGDLARRRPDGMLELLGRKDHRVKIRGYTVDLEAVESALARLPGINEAVVVPKTTAHDTILIAYVCLAATTTDRSITMQRVVLAKELPAYMLPGRIIVLDALPRQSNGKVNWFDLPMPDAARPDLDTPYVAPRSELEQQLADIWAEVLELDEVGIADSFFDLGGDSITTMAMLLKVEQYTGCTIPRAFLCNPTIATIAGLLAGGAVEPPLDPVSATGAANIPTAQASGSARLPGLLRRLARGVENRIFEHPLGMPYQEGMNWLRGWAGQPLVQRIRYSQQRRLFRAFAASFDSPLTDDTGAFAEAILNSIWGQYIRQIGLGRPVAEYLTALQDAPWRFWRDLGNQLAASLRAPNGPAPFEIAGEALLQDAIRQGRGVILAAPHLPTLGVYKVILASLGIVPHSVTGAAFREAHAELTAANTSSPISPHRRVQRAHELLRARELLQQGEAVYIPIDAAAGVGPRIYTPVGERLFPFNVGAIELALATGAPMLPMTTLLQPDNRLRLTVGVPLDTGDAGLPHAERVWSTAQACGAFLTTLWRGAPYARTWGDMRHYLAVSRTPAEVSPGQWIDFDKRRVHDA